MTPAENQLSVVLVTLMKGVTYRDADPTLWQALMALQGRVHEYVSVIGLELIFDEAEGYAFLRQRPAVEDSAGNATDIAMPRLVPRRQLGFGVSLLLALLRKTLTESDVKSGDTRLVMSREEIVDLMRLFMPDSTNEARAADRLDTHIARVVELGFLRHLQGGADQFEVRRILKAFVDAQWLSTLDQRLAEYRAHAVARD
jgi:hypothetical protein